jgi:hypothetical protein
VRHESGAQLELKSKSAFSHEHTATDALAVRSSTRTVKPGARRQYDVVVVLGWLPLAPALRRPLTSASPDI